MTEIPTTQLSIIAVLYAAVAARFRIKWNTQDCRKSNVIHLEILTVAGEPVAKFSQTKADSRKKTKNLLAQKALEKLQGDST